jgi:hypothetical protein
VTDEQRDVGPLGLPAVEPGSARQATNEMIDAGLLDHFMSKVDADGWRSPRW